MIVDLIISILLAGFFSGAACLLTYTDSWKFRLYACSALHMILSISFILLSLHRTFGWPVIQASSNLIIVLHILITTYDDFYTTKLSPFSHAILSFLSIFLSGLHSWFSSDLAAFPPWPVVAVTLSFPAGLFWLGPKAELRYLMDCLITAVLLFNGDKLSIVLALCWVLKNAVLFRNAT